MIVTDQSLSAPLRSTAFHAACSAAAKSTSPITAGLIAVPTSPATERWLRFLLWRSLAPKGNDDTSADPIPTPALPGSGSRGRPATGTSQPYTAPPGDWHYDVDQPRGPAVGADCITIVRWMTDGSARRDYNG